MANDSITTLNIFFVKIFLFFKFSFPVFKMMLWGTGEGNVLWEDWFFCFFAEKLRKKKTTEKTP